MSETVIVNYWASFLFSFRRLHNLTQDQLADRLKVSQQTVSRWEAGQQVPDPRSQAILREVLGEADLSSKKNWVERIRRASGSEALVDRNLCVLAASNKILERFDLQLEDVVGKHVGEFFPKNRPMNMERAVAEGVFEGALASVHWASVAHFGHKTEHSQTDVWPILTTDAGILLQVVIVNRPGPQTPGAERVETLDVVMAPNDFVGHQP